MLVVRDTRPTNFDNLSLDRFSVRLRDIRKRNIAGRMLDEIATKDNTACWGVVQVVKANGR